MSSPVRIPADVDRPDRIVAGLTGRQLLILAGAATLLYLAWTATRTVVPLSVFLLVAIPIGGGAVALALGRREGMSLDRLVLAAVRQRLQPRHRVAAPEGLRPIPEWMAQRATAAEEPHHVGSPRLTDHPAALRLPAENITDAGMVDLGSDGIAAVAVAGTVNFGLRTPAEQDALIATFARWLHSLTSPVQIVIRAERLDLSGQIADLHAAAPALPHAALEHAAREHAEYLAQLAAGADLLRRQVLLVLREPLREPLGSSGSATGRAALTTPITRLAPTASSYSRPPAGRRSSREQRSVREAQRRAAEGRLVRRLAEVVDLLAPAGIVVTPLDAGQATAVLAAACNPDSLVPPSTGVAGADEVITTAPEPIPSPDAVPADDWLATRDPHPAQPTVDSWTDYSVDPSAAPVGDGDLTSGTQQAWDPWADPTGAIGSAARRGAGWTAQTDTSSASTIPPITPNDDDWEVRS